ncbi:MAG: hypothetical protein H6766_04440 [Candidatus Peribacteria bacterium]|nr:MAG: hypothetical protein H6766_04440 [Candidatus Peribacteria bacterium]
MDYQQRIEIFQQQSIERQRETIQVIVNTFIDSNDEVLQDMVSLRSSVEEPSSLLCSAILQLMYAILAAAEHQKDILQENQKIQLRDKLQKITLREEQEQEDVDILLDTII